MPWESNSLREEKAAAWVMTDATEVIHSFKWIGGSTYYVPGAALSTGDTAVSKQPHGSGLPWNGSNQRLTLGTGPC